MGYYNYHAKIKRLIKEGHLVDFEYYDRWNNISNCFVLFFDNHRPMPIRNYRYDEYKSFLKENNIQFAKKIDK